MAEVIQVSDYALGYFAGFCSGDGCFRIRTCNERGTTRYYPCLTFAQRMDDLPLLEAIHDWIPGGYLYTGREREGSNPYAQLMWKSRKALEALLPVVKLCRFYGLKRDQVEIWIKATELYLSHPPYHPQSDEHKSQMKAYRDAITDLKRFGDD